jgi:hypothetical protein
MHPLRRRLLSLALSPCALATSLPTPAQETPLENASWIWAAGEPGAAPAPICFFRRALRLDAPPVRVELFVTAENVYELYCAVSEAGGAPSG